MSMLALPFQLYISGVVGAASWYLCALLYLHSKITLNYAS